MRGQIFVAIDFYLYRFRNFGDFTIWAQLLGDPVRGCKWMVLVEFLRAVNDLTERDATGLVRRGTN